VGNSMDGWWTVTRRGVASDGGDLEVLLSCSSSHKSNCPRHFSGL
jgi:hypothetical protein